MHVMIAPGGPYHHAWLTQKCIRCDWTETSHGMELELCPKCRAPVDPKRTLQSGVLRIELTHKKNRFYVHEHRQSVTLYDPDIPDLFKFVLRNYEDWSGDIAPVNPVQNLLQANNLGGLKFRQSLFGEEYDEGILRFLENMKDHNAEQLNRLWGALQQLAGFVCRDSERTLKQIRDRLILAASYLKAEKPEEARAVLGEVLKALGG